MWTSKTKQVIQILHRTPVNVVVTFSPSLYLDSELISKLAQPVKATDLFSGAAEFVVSACDTR